ncbi:MmcB family DNA repair protein [Desulfosporosinus sp. SB140]
MRCYRLFQRYRIMICKVKASMEDFRRHAKWQEYLAYCDAFYFLNSLF